MDALFIEYVLPKLDHGAGDDRCATGSTQHTSTTRLDRTRTDALPPPDQLLGELARVRSSS